MRLSEYLIIFLTFFSLTTSYFLLQGLESIKLEQRKVVTFQLIAHDIVDSTNDRVRRIHQDIIHSCEQICEE